MNIRVSSTALLVMALSWTALAQTTLPIREGLWEVNSKLAGMGSGMPMKSEQCITAAMLKDPESSIPKMGNCKVSDYKLENNTATYTVMCTEPIPMTAAGEIKYSGTDAYSGTLKLAGTDFSLTYEGKRIGDCAK